MKLTWAAAVVLGLGLAAMAGAQNAPNTPRAMGMGSAVIGVADDAGAWAQNPAGLGALHVRTQDGKAFGNDVVIALGKVRPGNDTALGINWSGWNPLTTVGFGAGLNRMGDTKTFGAGVGMGYRNSMLTWGVDVRRVERDTRDDTVFEVGAMYRIVQSDGANTRLGLKIFDLGNATDMGPQVGLGVGWPATENLFVAVDLVDVLCKTSDGPYLNGGVEYKLGQAKEWRARGGFYDTGDSHKLTLGVGLVLAKVRLDVGYMNTDSSSWMAGAGFDF